MYQYLQRHRVGLYEKALPNDFTWDEKLIHTKSLGFDFLEMSIDESDQRRNRLDWDDNYIYGLRRLCEQHGIPIQSMCLSAHRLFPFGSTDPNIRQQAAILMDKAISLAYKLGIRVIQLAGYDVYYESSNEETHLNFVKGMRLSSKMAEKSGVMLAVEIMDTHYLNSLSKFEVLNRMVDSPFFTAYPDVGNISGWNYDVCTELTLSLSHISQIHIKDSLPKSQVFRGQFRDLVIGEGQVNFDAIFQTLKKVDCVVPLVIEMWAKDERWRENILTAQQHLNLSCERAGLPLLFTR